jgi:RNAse (barnase) inhibitor barstar
MQTKMRTIVINGNNFSNLPEFYNEVERKMTNGLNWKIGHNLDAFNDVLSGGFGVHEIDENFELKWLYSEKSKAVLKEFQTLIDIIKENKNIKLKFN